MQGLCAGVTCKSHVQGLYAGIICKSHIQRSYKLPGAICIYKWTEFNSTESLRVKYRCQLVVRLKANNCYQELLCYLSSYINSLNIRLCSRLQAFSRFQIFSLWSRTHNSFSPYPTLLVIIILLAFFQSIVCNYFFFAKELFLIVYLVNCLVKHPIAFSLTKPLASVVYSLNF